VTSVASTSLAAYHALPVTDLEELVCRAIASFGIEGCISDQVRDLFPSLSYSSVTARFSALEEKAMIFRAGDTRPGESGRRQKVMRDIRYASSVPVVVATTKMNPYLRGMIAAAKIVKASSDLHSAKDALYKELKRVLTK